MSLPDYIEAAITPPVMSQDENNLVAHWLELLHAEGLLYWRDESEENE